MLTYTKYEQSAFALACDGKVLVADVGAYSAPESLQALTNLHPVANLVSHIHPDHFSEANLQALNTPVYTVREVAEAITERGPQVYIAKEGDSIEIPQTEFRVEFVASDHGPNISKPVENVGFVIHVCGKRVYLLGDMAVPTPAPDGEFDLVLVPVGNKGYVFNPEEAAAHLRTLKVKGIVVPIHYDGSLDPKTADQFVELVKNEYDVRKLQIGESIEL